MKTHFIHFCDDNSEKLEKFIIDLNGRDTGVRLGKLRGIMQRSLNCELTELQRFCITEHYYHSRQQKDIARELGVAPSTVSRHINRGLKKLRNIASYYAG